MGVGLFIGIWVARYLGPENYGVLNFSVAFAGLFSAFAFLGLDNIVIKELVHPLFSEENVLGTATILKFFGGIVAILLSTIALIAMNPGDYQLLIFILILTTGYLFQSFDTIDFWFQSKVLSKYPVIARNFAFIISSAIKIGLIFFSAPLVYFIGVISLELMLSAFFLILVYLYNQQNIRTWKFDLGVAKQLLKSSFPLFLTLIAIGIYMKIDLVLVRQLLNNFEAGIYAVAVGISGLWYFIPSGIVLTLFPSVIRTRINNQELYYRRMQALFDLMAILSIGLSIIITLSAPFLITMLYGPAYDSASRILMIYVWGAVPIFLASASANFLIAENQHKILLGIAMFNCFVNIVLNIQLIPILGPAGAAIAMVITQFAGLLCIGVVKPLRPQFFMIARALNPLRLIRFRVMIDSLQKIF